MHVRTLVPIFVFSIVSCDPGPADEVRCEPGQEPASLTVDNRTGGVISTITARKCDDSEEHVLELPADGLAFSEQATVELPAPGCWLLTWTGEECMNDPAHRTASDVCAGDTYTWTATTADRTCEPGGW